MLGPTGLASLVDVSGDVEIHKPDLRLFEIAASRCGVSLADGGWMVGDNPAGASWESFPGCWVGRSWAVDTGGLLFGCVG
ncbi:hypothetical protein ACH4ET_33270, partial [Streptomyces californicus]